MVVSRGTPETVRKLKTSIVGEQKAWVGLGIDLADLGFCISDI
jgi:hypothetical protein